MKKQNYYEILGVSSRATTEEIRKAYQLLSLQYNPNSAYQPYQQDSSKKFEAIAKAYSVLSDSNQRHEYDYIHGYFGTTMNVGAETETTSGNEKIEPVFKAPDAQGNVFEAGGMEDIAQSYSRSKEYLKSQNQKHQYSGPNPARFNAGERTPSPMEKLKDQLKSIPKSFGGFGVNPPAHDDQPKPEPHQQEIDCVMRELNLTIDALESLRGSVRQVDLPGGEDGNRVVRVHIPAGVKHGATLKVRPTGWVNKPGEVIMAKVEITPHPIVEREGYDVLVKMPLSIGEAILGTEIEVPTPEGSVRVKVPPLDQHHKRLRVKGHGVKDRASGKQGDLYVIPYIVPPDKITDAVKEAAKAIDAHYMNPVRKDIPKTLA